MKKAIITITKKEERMLWKKDHMLWKKSGQLIIMALALSLLLPLGVKAAEDFPLREKYPTVPFVTSERLNAEYNNIIIVDVRSQFEYDVIHVKKAVHSPLSSKTFTDDLLKFRAKDSSQTIAFYCNGHTCAKSYKAAKKAMGAGYKNVFAYDAGIFDWTKGHPDKAVLLGKSPVDLTKLISKKDLNARMINYGKFVAQASDPNAVLIDIRDPFQREVIPKVTGLKNIPLDKLTPMLSRGDMMGKDLYFIDAVGKQVRWLQYYLEDKGYKNYSFVKKGVLTDECC